MEKFTPTSYTSHTQPWQPYRTMRVRKVLGVRVKKYKRQYMWPTNSAQSMSNFRGEATERN